MIIFNKDSNRYEIDPYYLTITPLKKVWFEDDSPGRVIAKAKLFWLYHMYNPHSPFRDYKTNTKSVEIVLATFPENYIEQKKIALQALIDEANLKNKDIDALADIPTVDTEKKPAKIKKPAKLAVPTLKIYDPEEDDDMQEAITWYRDYHLTKTPLWDSYHAYGEAMYNLSAIIRDPDSGAGDIKTASQELDTLPRKRENMRQQAVKDEAMTLKVSGDKNIKRGEKLPAELQKGKSKMEIT